ncbi:MAG TPA: hypothetical protein VHM88_14960, partial [Candidatus Acidoferrales bacterium]|nr:hypothetical protein [Candidatus Acidoferrales bacterium]
MSTPILMLVQGLDGGSAIALALLVTAMFAMSVGATEPKEGRSVVIALALAIAAWFGVSSAMASAGDFGSGALALPLLGFALLVPLAIGVAVSLGVGYFRRLLSQPAVQPAVIA